MDASPYPPTRWDRTGLWDRIAAAPPDVAELCRLAYQAGLEDGAVLGPPEDRPTDEVSMVDVIKAQQKKDRRAAADAGTLFEHEDYQGGPVPW